MGPFRFGVRPLNLPSKLVCDPPGKDLIPQGDGVVEDVYHENFRIEGIWEYTRNLFVYQLVTIYAMQEIPVPRYCPCKRKSETGWERHLLADKDGIWVGAHAILKAKTGDNKGKVQSSFLCLTWED
jgi:hypothetical protein